MVGQSEDDLVHGLCIPIGPSIEDVVRYYGHSMEQKVNSRKTHFYNILFHLPLNRDV